MFANGFVSVDTAVTCTTVGSNCFFANADMPTATNPNGIMAPYWDDLVLTSACQLAAGTKLTIQWTGTLFNVTPTQTVSMQLILDGSNDKVEFVYGRHAYRDGLGRDGRHREPARPAGEEAVVQRRGRRGADDLHADVVAVERVS